MHRSEVLANLTEAAKALFRIVERGGLANLMVFEPRAARPTRAANCRLSPLEIEQLVQDYRTGVGSIYVLADKYGLHRNTVASHLKAHDIVLGRLPLDEAETARARELRDEGLSLNAIGRAIGRDPKTVKGAVASE